MRLDSLIHSRTTKEAEQQHGNSLIICLDGVVMSTCHLITYLRSFHYLPCSGLQHLVLDVLETKGLDGKRHLPSLLGPKSQEILRTSSWLEPLESSFDSKLLCCACYLQELGRWEEPPGWVGEAPAESVGSPRDPSGSENSAWRFLKMQSRNNPFS